VHRAVLLDRDGTVSEEVGYVNHVDRFRIYPFAAEAIRRLNRGRVKVVIVTNQSGVARGLFPESLVRELHERMREELSHSQAFLDGVYYCPHHPAGKVVPYNIECDCRKPKPGMLRRAAEDLGLDLRRSYVIGDKYTDLETAFGVGARAALVLSGYGKGEMQYNSCRWPRQPDFVGNDLLAVVDWVLSQTAVPER
jgi:D-glycero-D-manno-heptose 1,7-bisphosphate phosphatase